MTRLLFGVLLVTSLQTPIFKAYGLGAVDSCATWLRNQAAQQRVRSDDDIGSAWRGTAELSWVQGFVSGVAWSGRALAETDGRALEIWITSYCQTRPLDTVAEASMALAGELHARQLSGSPR